MKKIESTPSSVYLMHKYWGKKPSNELRNLINKYTKVNDMVLDPFSGYGGIGIESILTNRNVILNDLNPIANYISNCILEPNVNIEKLRKIFENIREQYKTKEAEWYTYKGDEILTILRNKDDVPLKIKIKNKQNKKIEEISLTQVEAEYFLCQEQSYTIKEWYPKTKLIRNSRIGSKENMKVSDLFPKRALICQAYLYNLLVNLENSPEKNLLICAFTSNLANCSKLVPPISSRGEMSQGAWMTGFYIGEKYLENNVFHYYENRVNKIIKGKEEYLEIYNNNISNGKFIITNDDAKKLKINSETVDFVFTDFPYGDSVPYFEQSQLWNAWLNNEVDYENEIVVSDSKERNKDVTNFAKDIEKSIAEINRVLKDKAYFVFTFHSIQGKEWNAIANAMAKHNFKFVDCEMLLQKTLPPRQLNRKVTIKGDLVVTYQKIQKAQNTLSGGRVYDVIISEIRNNCNFDDLYDTNELITLCVKTLLKQNIVSENIDFIKLIQDNFEIDVSGSKWRLKNDI